MPSKPTLPPRKQVPQGRSGKPELPSLNVPFLFLRVIGDQLFKPISSNNAIFILETKTLQPIWPICKQFVLKISLIFLMQVRYTLKCHQSLHGHQANTYPRVDQVNQSYQVYLCLCLFKGHSGPII